MIFPRSFRNTMFTVFSVLFLLAALYHFLALFVNMDKSPAWRHLLFVVIDLLGMVAMVKRPGYLIYLFGALCVQQYYSHGAYLIQLFQNEGRIHWISVFVLLLLPIGLICLWEERREM